MVEVGEVVEVGGEVEVGGGVEVFISVGGGGLPTQQQRHKGQ